MPQACYALRTRLRMPKKSKKEKIIAELRRKVQTQQILTPSPTFQYQAIKENTIPVLQHVQQHSSELIAIKKDLYKTFILAVVAIAAEIIIYFVKR